MKPLWRYICEILIAILEQILAMPPDANHQPIAKAGLDLVKKLTVEEVKTK